LSSEKEDLFRSLAKEIDWKQIRDGLAHNEAAVKCIHFKSSSDSLDRIIYAAMIIKHNSEHPKVVWLCSQAEIEKILEQQGLNYEMVKKIYGERKSINNSLYQKVWAPIEPSLKGVEKIYYSPTGLLHKVSFAAVGDNDQILLCDNYDLYQQSSTSRCIESIEVNYSSTDRFMLVGGIRYNSSSTQNEIWSYLPGTEKEVSSIAAYLTKKKHDIDQLEGDQAKETLLKERAENAAILHISTHGFFFPDPKNKNEKNGEDISFVDTMNFRGMNGIDSLTRSSTSYLTWNFVSNENPLMRSGLVLAGANDVWQRDPMQEGDDGVLTAQEVSNLNLDKTKLVVLSACETGLGDIRGSEGVFGLQRAFKMAGADFLIMSLWQVPDKETSEFMELFYRNLTNKKDIRQAFQLTQRTMRKNYSPYYWAAFVLIN
jgi:CHAT domain-containing protein